MLPFNLAFTFSGFRWTLVSISQCWLLLIFLETDSFPTGNYFGKKPLNTNPNFHKTANGFQVEQKSLTFSLENIPSKGGKKQSFHACKAVSQKERTRLLWKSLQLLRVWKMAPPPRWKGLKASSENVSEFSQAEKLVWKRRGGAKMQSSLLAKLSFLSLSFKNALKPFFKTTGCHSKSARTVCVCVRAK